MMALSDPPITQESSSNFTIHPWQSTSAQPLKVTGKQVKMSFLWSLRLVVKIISHGHHIYLVHCISLQLSEVCRFAGIFIFQWISILLHLNRGNVEGFKEPTLVGTWKEAFPKIFYIYIYIKLIGIKNFIVNFILLLFYISIYI